MAVATYTTPLSTQVVDDADADTKWSEMTGRTSGGAATADNRAYIQGAGAISQSTGVATGRTTGLQCDYGSAISWTSGWVFLIWQYWQAPKAIGTWADGGMRLGVGSSAGNVYLWNTHGTSYGRNPYGGWANVAVDPEYRPVDETIGSPSEGTYQIFCSAPYLTAAVSKGNPHCVDAIRYGRGQLKIEFGQAGAYGTFDGMATANDADAARWGLFSLQMGSYLWKGLMSLGTDTNAVNFVDANRSIIVDACPRTYLAFNRIEIRNASSVVTWSNISFNNIGTLSPGQLEVVANATVSMDGCSFSNMDTFIFQSNSTITNTIFKSCKLITSGGGHFNGSKVLTPGVAADASAFQWNVAVNPDGYLDNMTFTKGTSAHHAIAFGTSASTTIDLRGLTFTGFNAANGENDSVLYFSDKGSDTTWTVGGIGCTGTITYKKARAGDTVNITQGVALSIHVQDSITGSYINGAAVMVKAASGGPKPYQASVGITASGTTATVAHTTHGLATNDYVIIEGCVEGPYNGGWQITVTGVDAYQYTMNASPSSPATGTPVSTFSPIYGITTGTGDISNTRTYSSSQPFTGRVRKATSAPLYKTQPISGTINSSTGASLTVNMISDD